MLARTGGGVAGDVEAQRRRRWTELLARADLFTGIDRVTLAKVAANLDPLSFKQSEAACRQGEPGDSLYIVTEGTFGVFVGSEDGGRPARVATFGRGASFGEMALLTGEPRSATVIADSDGELLQLDKDRFKELLRLDPNIGLAVSASLSRRLRDTSRSVKESDALVQETVAATLRQLPDGVRRAVLQAGELAVADATTLATLFAGKAQATGAALSDLGEKDGRLPPPILRALHSIHQLEEGAEKVRSFGAAAAHTLAQGGSWRNALALAETHFDRRSFLELAERALAADPTIAGDAASTWIDRLSDEDVAGNPVLAAARAARDTQLVTAPVRPGRWQRVGQAVRTHLPRGAALAASLALIGAAINASVASKPNAFMLLLGAAIVLWVSGMFPEFVVYLGLVVGWVYLGIAKPSVAVAGFGSTAWVSVFAILAIASALSASGLVFRLGLMLGRRLPRGLFAQGAAFLGSGLLLTVMVPSSSARARLLLPTALAAAQSQRLRERGQESAFLGLVTFIGSVPLMYIFLNGSSSNFLGLGLLPAPERAHFDLLFWFAAAGPLALFVAAMSIVTLWLILRPHRSGQSSSQRIDLQLSLLGRPAAREIAMAFILCAMVVGFNVGPSFDISTAIVGITALVAAAAIGCFRRPQLQSLNWDFLISYGVILSFPPIVSGLGIDTMIAEAVRELIGTTPVTPAMFVLATVALNFVVRLALPDDQTLLLLAVVLIPIGGVFGVHPWIVVITLLSTFSIWLLPSQLTTYIAAYEASEERMFSHAQARIACVAFLVISVIGLMLSLPYWHLLGLI